ncbi:hypothetical protein A3F66_00515 [candidate division TM6 bacterium RIFCSPHIGHO2_12_FULL_32_22]|nr:MAG: hypothetical protein A3F66_00515 [candidate division TM6 bacterium RIFCSPHIGHO2_12_FULL_32_22]
MEKKLKQILVLILLSLQLNGTITPDIRKVVIFSCFMQNGVKLSDKLSDISSDQQYKIIRCLADVNYSDHVGNCAQQGMFEDPKKFNTSSNCDGCCGGCSNCTFAAAMNQSITQALNDGYTVGWCFGDMLYEIGENVKYCLQQNDVNSLFQYIVASNVPISFSTSDTYNKVLSCLRTYNIPAGLTTNCNQQGLFPTLDLNNNLLEFQPAACQSCSSDKNFLCDAYAVVNETYQKNFMGSDQIAYKTYQCLLNSIGKNGTYGDVLAKQAEIGTCISSGEPCIAQGLFYEFPECTACCNPGGNFLTPCIVACSTYMQTLTKIRSAMQYMGLSVKDAFPNCTSDSCSNIPKLTQTDINNQLNKFSAIAEQLGNVWQIINQWKWAYMFEGGPLTAQDIKDKNADANNSISTAYAAQACVKASECTKSDNGDIDTDASQCSACITNKEGDICKDISAITFLMLPKFYKDTICKSCNNGNTTATAVTLSTDSNSPIVQANQKFIEHYCSSEYFKYYVDSNVYNYLNAIGDNVNTDVQNDIINKDMLPIFDTYFYPQNALKKNLYNIFSLPYLAFTDKSELTNSQPFKQYILSIFQSPDITQLTDKAFNYDLSVKCLKASDSNQKAACLLCPNGDCINKVLGGGKKSDIVGYLDSALK